MSSISGPLRHLSRTEIPGGGQITVRGSLAFVGHMAPPLGTTILDVSDPRKPSIVCQIEIEEKWTKSHKVRVTGDLMIVNQELYNKHFFKKHHIVSDAERELTNTYGRHPTDEELASKLDITRAGLDELRAFRDRGYHSGGFKIFDISNPTKPHLLKYQRTGGIGVHRFDCDEQYAYISTEMDGYSGNILVVYDIRKPSDPREVSRWWIEGQNTGNGESPSWSGNEKRLHHVLRKGDKLWASCWRGGAYVIDVSDIEKPRTIGHYGYQPPWPFPTHTVLPVPHPIRGRRLALVADEEMPHPDNQPCAFLWVLDVTDLGNIQALSTFHVTDFGAKWRDEGGAYPNGYYGPGLHQIQEHLDSNLVSCAWFAAGLRVVDISDPFCPREVAHYMPGPAPGSRLAQTNDVFVDDRGLIYIVDRIGGLDILEMT